MAKEKNKKKYYIVGVSLCLVIAITIVYFVIQRRNTPCAQYLRSHPENASLHAFSTEELSHYDGIKDEKTYVGYHCIVYDVTEGKDQYYAQGKSYHYLVGRDATKQLELFGGDIIESKYPKVGILTQ